MMAGWFDKLRRAVEPDEEPYDFDEEEVYPSNDMDDGMIRPNNNAPMGNMYSGNNNIPAQQNNNFGGGGYNSPMPNQGTQQPGFPMNNNPQTNMVPTNNAPIVGISGSQSTYEIIAVTPAEKDGFEVIMQVAQHLMNNKAVVLDLENTNKEKSRRFLDFLNGVAYAIGGVVKQVGSSYILSPSSVAVSSYQNDKDDRSGRMDRPF